MAQIVALQPENVVSFSLEGFIDITQNVEVGASGGGRDC